MNTPIRYAQTGLAVLGAAALAYHATKTVGCLSKKLLKHCCNKKKRVGYLITGACGELGHALVQVLHKTHPEVDVITMDLAKLPEEMKPFVAKHYIGSVTDQKSWDAIHEDYVVLRLFHLASLLSSSGERDPFLAADVNMNGFMLAIKFALKQKEEYGQEFKFTPQVVFTSSIAAFGVPTLEAKTKAGALTEGQYLHPLTMYGINKLQCEMLGQYFEKNFHMLPNGPKVGMIDFRCIRFPGLISAFTVPSGGTSDYGPEMLHNAAQNKDYKTFVFPTTRMPFMSMDDAVTALTMLSEAPKISLQNTVYNVSAFSPTAQEICNEVKKHFPAAKIEFTDGPNPRCNILDSWPADMNYDAAKKDFGFAPKHATLTIAMNDYLLPHVKARYGCK